MKVYNTLLFIFGISLASLSQSSADCVLIKQDDPISPQEYLNMRTVKNLSEFEPVTFNLFFWGFTKTDQSGNIHFTLKNIQDSVNRLNELYNQCNVSFVLLGYEKLAEEDYYVLENPLEFYDMIDDMKNTGNARTDAFNIYVSNVYQGFGGIVENFHRTFVGIPAVHLINAGTLEHEMGHCFNLRHTNVNDRNGQCESAVRDPNDLLYNADITGDFVHDTPACYFFNSSEIDPDTCALITDKKDCYGYPYKVPASLIYNYMTTSSSFCEKDRLTEGQFMRIRKSITFDPFGSFEAATVE